VDDANVGTNAGKTVKGVNPLMYYSHTGWGGKIACSSTVV